MGADGRSTMFVAALLACHPTEPPDAAIPPAPVPSSSTPTSPDVPVPGPVLAPSPLDPCERDPAFDDWPAGRTLRLDTASIGPLPPSVALSPGADIGLDVRGALPGEELHFFVGDVCGLDCPPDRDGACFQPVDSHAIGTAVADAAGAATLTVIPDPSWNARWLVFQVTGPDRGAISQAWVDRIGPWHEPIVARYEAAEISPLTLHSQACAIDDGFLEQESWVLPVAAGRRLRVAYDTTDDAVDAVLVSDGEASWLPIDSRLDTEIVLDRPGTLYWDQSFDYFGVEYSIDATTEPLPTALPWYPDRDGDGYGDLLGVPVLSTTPVDDASPNGFDCDDGDPAVRPEGAETCDDGRDQDCDGPDRACTETPGLTTVPDVGTRFVGTTESGSGIDYAVGDVDADGILDLIATGRPTTVFPLGRQDVVATASSLPSATSAAVGDLTGDGQPDLLLASPPELQVFASPLLSPVVRILTTSSEISPAIGDVSGDGVPDLVSSNASGASSRLDVYLGPLAGIVSAPDGTIPVSAGGLSRPDVALGDADGDGLPDVWTHEVCLFLAPVDLTAAVAAGCVDDGVNDNLAIAGSTSADVDGDGHADLVIGDATGARVFLGPLSGNRTVADGTWAVATDDGASNWWESGVVPDRDGDGAPELILATLDSVWQVSAAPGSYTEADGTRLRGPAVGATPSPVVGGDFDGDGSGDLVIGSTGESWGNLLSPGVTTVVWGP